ncbi:MAG: PilN domain-containing protein [bacterium]
MLDLGREFKKEEQRLRIQSLLQTLLIIVFLSTGFANYYIFWLRENIVQSEIKSIDTQLAVLLPIEDRIKSKTLRLNSLIADRKAMEVKLNEPRANLGLVRDISIYAPLGLWLTSLNISSSVVTFDGYSRSIKGIKDFVQSLIDNLDNSSLSKSNIQRVKLEGDEYYSFHIEIGRGGGR